VIRNLPVEWTEAFVGVLIIGLSAYWLLLLIGD